MSRLGWVPEEVERLVWHVATRGLRPIALVTQENAFGQEAAQAKSDASNAAQAAGRIIEATPEAVLPGQAGKPTVGFVKAFRAGRRAASTSR